MQLPTGAGESRTIHTGDVQVHQAFFFPDGRHILEVGNQAGHGLRLWMQDSQSGNPQPISPEGVSTSYRTCISPDGKLVAARDPEGGITIYSVNGGKPVPVRNAQPGEMPAQWAADGKALLVGSAEVPTRVFMIDLATGQRKLFRTFSPVDPTGLFDTFPPNFARDLKSYVYSYTRILSDLYIVDGLK